MEESSIGSVKYKGGNTPEYATEDDWWAIPELKITILRSWDTRWSMSLGFTGPQWAYRIMMQLFPIKDVPINLNGSLGNILNFGTDPLVENVWKWLDEMTSWGHFQTYTAEISVM